MTPIVPAASSAQLLSLVPRLLGHAPTRSLVLVPFAGDHPRRPLRLDLPDAGVEGETDRFAATAIGLVCRSATTDAVAIVVYADADIVDPKPAPHADLFAALAVRSRACGIAMRDALWVAGEARGSYSKPLPEEEAGGGCGPHGADGAVPTVAPSFRAEVAAALGSLEEAILRQCGPDAERGLARRRPGVGDAVSGAPSASQGRLDPRSFAALCALDDLPEFFERMLDHDPERADAFDVAALAWCLGRPAVRDAALLQWCADISVGDAAVSAQLRWEAGEDYPTELGRTMWGQGEAPDAARLTRALALSRRVAGSVAGPVSAGALAASAWLAWAAGLSDAAADHARAARLAAPGHGLADLVLTFVAAGHTPEWTATGRALHRPRTQAGTDR